MEVNFLNRERERFLSVTQRLDEGILIFDENKNLCFFNKKAKDLLSFQEKDVLGKSPIELKSLPSFRPLFEITGFGLLNVFDQKIEIGNRVILKIISTDLLKGGEKIGSLVILKDVTRENLIEKMKSEFVSLVAHQLRTPISSMRWMLKELIEEKRGKLNEKQKEYLEEMYLNNERIVQFLNDLLSTIRIEEGKYLKKKEPFSLEAVVELAIKLFKPEIEKRRLEIKYERPSRKLPLVKIDVEGIKTVVENLLNNAIRYTNPGGEIEISLRAPITETEVEFSIRDNGIGIAEDEKERIFSKFFRGKGAVRKETEGSGLGLYICKNIIEAHGGEIWFESKEGEGTIFHFSLPIEKE